MSLVALKFGVLVRETRESLGLSQEELAYKLRLSRVSIANYETGKQCPSLETAFNFAKVLKFSLDDLNKKRLRLKSLRTALH